MKDREQIIKSYFPKHLRESSELSLYTEMTSKELSKIGDLIEMFSNLSDVDRVPNRFLKFLGELVGYKYQEGVDPDIQREIIQRLFTAYHERGSLDDLYNALNYGYSREYQQGLITQHNKINSQNASVQYVDQQLFVISKSKLSSTHRIKDSIRWREGVINIVLSNITAHLEETIKKTLPAGIRYYFDTAIIMGGGSEGMVSFADRRFFKEIHSNIEQIQLKINNAFTPSTDDKISVSPYISGNKKQFGYVFSEHYGYNSQLDSWDLPEESNIQDIEKPNLVYNTQHIDNRYWICQKLTYYKGLPKLSSTLKLSRKLALSGSKTGVLYKSNTTFNKIQPSSQHQYKDIKHLTPNSIFYNNALGTQIS